jgi:glutathione S-transferase
VPSAIERYNAQSRRVLEVLEGWLTDKQWLVGDRMSYADLAFVPWNDRFDAVVLCPEEEKFSGLPNVTAWHQRMVERPSWKAAMEHRARGMDEQGLMWNGMPKGMKSFKDYVDKIAAGEDTSAK